MANATSFRLYHDAALTQEITSGNPLTATQETGGGLGPVLKTIYLGSTASGTKIQVTANPGVTGVQLNVIDAAPGSGAPATEFKMGLSAAARDAAVAGAALVMSHTILSGVANAVPIYTRRESAIAVAGAYTDVSFESNAVTETPV